MISNHQIKERLESFFDDAEVTVEDFRGDQYHFEVTVVSKKFLGLKKMEQHRLVYQALGEWVGNDIHALSIHTLIPNEVAL